MPDWNTRLAVSYEEGGQTVTISPIQSYNPSFSLNAEVLHSIEQTHIGVIYSPQSMSFSLTVHAIGDVAAKLTSLALEGKPFNIILEEPDGTDWAFSKIVMSNCVITSASPTNASPTGSPQATFSGFSLAASSQPRGGAAVEIP